MMRTHLGGELRAGDLGAQVSLCGWASHRRDHGGVVFLDLRDAGGIVQVVIDPALADCAIIERVRAEWVLRIGGVVRPRPKGTTNTDLDTGAIEVAATSVEVLSESEALPFPIDDRAGHGGESVDETLRLRHRYLDLRQPRLLSNLRLRSRVVSAVRTSMEAQGFIDVETPSLTRSTPEGARDFLVPSRLQPGSFYALPQSPQLFKQLLMVAGVERYYQVARCWRDEDLRADRGFEFTQLDLEASFVDEDQVMGFVEVAIAAAVQAATGAGIDAIERLTWRESMARFGTDKPDMRAGPELVACSEIFKDSSFRAFAGLHAVALRVPHQADLGRSELDRLTERAKSLGAGGLVWMRVREPAGAGAGAGDAGGEGGLESPVAKFLSATEIGALRASTCAQTGDLLLIVADVDLALAQSVLGALRLVVADQDRFLSDELKFCWVTEFPLFEGRDESGRLRPAHHPFTMPHADDFDLLESDPLAVRSRAYDLVVNGVELGSGSVRIHVRDLQQRIFDLLGIEPEIALARFGFLLDAFRYGAPPHAGFAFGIDRLAMILAKERSVREVMAFPKTQSGSDPLTGAPSSVDPLQLKALGITPIKPLQSKSLSTKSTQPALPPPPPVAPNFSV